MTVGAANLRTATASAGILGPTCFVGGWVAAAVSRPGFSSAQKAISQLAREGAPHRLLMTGAFVAFGILMPVFAQPLARALGGGLLLKAAVTLAGVSALGVASCPLSASGSGTRDLVHGAIATTGYVAMVASAGLGALALSRRQRTVAARMSATAATVAALSLAATTTGHDVGLFQRAGLTVIDVWFVVIAVSILRDRSSNTRRSLDATSPTVKEKPYFQSRPE
jgi:hypothetical membrane protein